MSSPRRVYYWSKTFTNADGSMNFVFENVTADCIYEIVFKLSGEGFNTLTKTENKYEWGSLIKNLNGLPTVDPKIVGRIWNDNGTLKISSGE